MKSLKHFAQKKLEILTKKETLRKYTSYSANQGSILKSKERFIVNFTSNDYLGLAHNYSAYGGANKIIKKYGLGSTSSPALSGYSDILYELEQEIAQYYGFEDACVFPSGYIANLSTIDALVSRGDYVVMDRNCHASIIDGVLLSNAKYYRFDHNNFVKCTKVLNKVRSISSTQHNLIITESLFSMDGDRPTLFNFLNLTETNWLMLDVCHEVKNMKSELDSAKNKDNLFLVGSLSKHIGAMGGYIVGNRPLILYLRNLARGLMYSTALPPVMAYAALTSLKILNSPKHEKRLITLLEKRVSLFYELLDPNMKPYIISTNKEHICVIAMPNNNILMQVKDQMLECGFLIGAIRTPTAETPRIRLSITVNHTEDQILEFCTIFNEIMQTHIERMNQDQSYNDIEYNLNHTEINFLDI